MGVLKGRQGEDCRGAGEQRGRGARVQRGRGEFLLLPFDGVLLDVSDRKHTEEQIIHNALHDPLTDLPNRKLLVEQLELSINQAKQIKTYHYAVLFIDLDRFSSVKHFFLFSVPSAPLWFVKKIDFDKEF